MVVRCGLPPDSVRSAREAPSLHRQSNGETGGTLHVSSTCHAWAVQYRPFSLTLSLLYGPHIDSCTKCTAVSARPRLEWPARWLSFSCVPLSCRVDRQRKR